MLTDVDFGVVYSSGEREPAEFFLDALINSTRFSLALGYFNTSAIRALSLGFASFVVNNGTMRIIINNILSEEDKDAIIKGKCSRPEELLEENLLGDIRRLYESLSHYDKHFFNCISWLIASKKIEIIAVTPSDNSSGIAHQKFGFFIDSAGSIVAFNGSANFTSAALFKNMETISCYKSWDSDSSDLKRIEYFEKTFADIWTGRNLNVKQVPIERIKTYIRSKFDIQDMDQLLDEEEALVDEAGRLEFIAGESAKAYQKKLEVLREKLKMNSIRQEGPILPNDIKLYDHQLQAYSKWQASDYVGLFEMATGTGKTIAALNCAIELYKKEGSIKVLVLVPTIPLSSQWNEEAQKLHFENIVMINSKSTEWQNQIIHLINMDFTKPTSFCFISTYASFGKPQFDSIVSKLSEKTLLIADEAHNFGTERQIRGFPAKFNRRIGLTATPKRYFDEEGTQAILKFFNSVDKPTYTLDMRTAIEKDLLCRYYYYPRIVFLTPDELSQYKDISTKLAKYFNFDTEKLQRNSIVEALLLKRKRIVNQAVGKLDCLRQILSELTDKYKPLRYTFVYVPEGNSILYGQDTKIIDAYAKIISQEFGLRQHQFIGSTKNRSNILSKFAQGELSVLTAMKCLDEGIDVKRAEIAIFSASTGNNRQFIQRRGRILRTHPDKHHAIIYDMVVVPSPSLRHLSESIKIERNLLRNELKRVAEMADISINKYGALKSLQNLANEYGIDIYSLYSAEYL